MAYRTDYNIMDALVEGHMREWYIHRYKRSLDGAAGAYPQMGTANDEGFDVPIGAISVLQTGTAGVCGFPTDRDWSNVAGAMEFKALFTSAGAIPADLHVDVSFYECSWGDSGQPERWEYIATMEMRHDDPPIKLVTDGKQIFAHIDDIGNPDAGVAMQLLCRMADSEGSSLGGGGGATPGPATNWDGAAITGGLLWDGTARDWVLWRGGDTTGALVDEIHSADIEIAVEKIAEAVMDHDDPPASDKVMAIGAQALSDITHATNAVEDGDIARPAMDLTRQLYVTSTGILLLADAIEDHDAALSDDAIMRVGGQAHAGTPPAVADLDNARLATDLTQSLRTYLSQGLDHTTSSVEAWGQPATGITSGSTAISNVAATAVAAAAIPCIEVTIQNRVGNGPIAVGDAGIAGVNEGTILQAGASITIDTDDVAKIFAWSTNLNDPLDWQCATR